MSRDAAIRFESVSKWYRTRHAYSGGLKSTLLHLPQWLRSARKSSRFYALTDVSLEIGKGECVSFVGRNGAGKSTILGLIAGVLFPDQGCVETRGRICPLLELGAGFHPELTGQENIILNGILLGMTRRQVLAQREAIIDFSELRDFIDAPLRTYSSGMISRLGFSVAVHLSPDILLVDETLAVGDSAFKAKCRERIWRFREQGVTMVFVTHEVELALEVSDRVAVVNAGRIVEFGDPEAAVERYLELVRPAGAPQPSLPKGRPRHNRDASIAPTKLLSRRAG